MTIMIDYDGQPSRPESAPEECSHVGGSLSKTAAFRQWLDLASHIARVLLAVQDMSKPGSATPPESRMTWRISRIRPTAHRWVPRNGKAKATDYPGGRYFCRNLTTASVRVWTFSFSNMLFT